MKLTISAFAICMLIIGTSNNDLTAQESWLGDYSASCGEQRGCDHESASYVNHSLESMPYGRNANYRSNRLPYQARFGYGTNNYFQDSGCGHDGSCNHGYQPSKVERGYGMQSQSRESGRCPYEQNQHENHSHVQNDFPSRMGPGYSSNYGSNNFDSSNFGYSQTYSTPATRQPEYRQSPADLRPQLRAPAFNPLSSFATNSRSESNGMQSAPPTSSRIIAPPQLPLQPTAGSRNGDQGIESQSQVSTDFPQLLPPTNAPGTQRKQAIDDPTGHDHSGHDHAGHNHDH